MNLEHEVNKIKTISHQKIDRSGWLARAVFVLLVLTLRKCGRASARLASMLIPRYPQGVPDQAPVGSVAGGSAQQNAPSTTIGPRPHVCHL